MDLKFVKKCDECENNFTVNNENTNYMQLVRCVENDQYVLITYFVCPKCKKVFFGQIDNSKTRMLARNLRVISAKIAGKKVSGKEVPKQQSSKAKKMNRDLDLARKVLREKYTGKTFINEKAGIVFKDVKFE